MLDYDDFLQADRPQVFGIHKVIPTLKLPPASPRFLQGSLKNVQYWQGGGGVQGRGGEGAEDFLKVIFNCWRNEISRKIKKCKL